MNGKIISYGKAVRKSKTSEVYELEGLSFFLYNTKSNTKGNCEIYLNSIGYPLIKVVESNEKAKLWLNNNITKVKIKIVSMCVYELINREDFIKPTGKSEDIVDSDYPTLEQMQIMHNNIIRGLND